MEAGEQIGNETTLDRRHWTVVGVFPQPVCDVVLASLTSLPQSASVSTSNCNGVEGNVKLKTPPVYSVEILLCLNDGLVHGSFLSSVR